MTKEERIQDLIIKTLHVYDHMSSTNYIDIDPKHQYALIVSEQIVNILDQEQNDKKRNETS